MERYRAFLLNEQGHIFKAIEIEASTPEDAVLEVTSLHEPKHGFELWRRGELIAEQRQGKEDASSGDR